jgi:hypothetical protein
MGAVNTVTDGAAMVGKVGHPLMSHARGTEGVWALSIAHGVFVCTWHCTQAAVNTVTDGAALVGKTVVSTATAVTDVVTTVADGAVGLGKVRREIAVSVEA